MSKYSSHEYKRLCRIMSVVTKGAERCLDTPDITEACVLWREPEYQLSLVMGVGDYSFDVHVEAEHKNPNVALKAFIRRLNEAVCKLISEYEKYEDEVEADLKRFGERFGDSPQPVLSGLKAWKMMIDSLD